LWLNTLPAGENNLGEVEVSASRIQNTAGRFIPNGTLGDMINALYNNAQLALVRGSGYKEMVAAALKKGGKNYYYVFSQKGASRHECVWNANTLIAKGYHVLFTMHTPLRRFCKPAENKPGSGRSRFCE
jgi:hypothetical protein